MRVLFYASCVILLAGLTYPATSTARLIPNGEKAKIKGSILSRSGDLLRVRDKKSGEIVVADLNADTKIERKKGKFLFLRDVDMDVTALVPGLTIEADGVGNSNGQLEADKVSFTPDEFAIEVAEERQIAANKAASQQAQDAANRSITAADQAQSAANHAQFSADEAGAVGAADAEIIAMINKRVSDLDHYTTAAEAEVYFANDEAVLDDADKKALDTLADAAMSLRGYMIEIAGYASSSGTKELNQKLSEARVAAVARYLREVKNIPMRRILAPAGYGATHPEATNADPQGRALNRRVDVKVLVNKGLDG